MKKPGKHFEEAVYRFARSLDPSAEALFNHGIRDRDTGKLRQCDAWINTSFGQHWPLSILVSCKDRRKSGRRLDTGDIGAFCDELRSTGATVGVIYTNTGFTGPALDKARANGITCCRLYQHEPADVPTVLCFEQFAVGQSIAVVLQNDLRQSGLKTWNDLFALHPAQCQPDATVLDIICDAFRSAEGKVVKEACEAGTFPRNFETRISVRLEAIHAHVVIPLLCRWTRYRARLQAHLVDGSWCVSTGSFRGTIGAPPISMKDAHPGQGGWVEVPDTDAALPPWSALAIRYQPDVYRALREEVGPRLLVPDSPICTEPGIESLGPAPNPEEHSDS